MIQNRIDVKIIVYLAYFSAFLHSVISLTECIVIVRVGKYCVSVCVCLSVCVSVCVSVCLFALERQNYWADFNETHHEGSPICLVVCVWF